MVWPLWQLRLHVLPEPSSCRDQHCLSALGGLDKSLLPVGLCSCQRRGDLSISGLLEDIMTHIASSGHLVGVGPQRRRAGPLTPVPTLTHSPMVCQLISVA